AYSDPPLRKIALEKIAEGADPNTCSKDGTPVLMLATDLKEYNLMEALLLHGADPNRKDPEGEAPLTKLCDRNDIPRKMVQLLLEKGANINIQNASGQTPLMLAILNQNRGIVHLLLAQGADLIIRNKEGNNALGYAMFWRDGALVQELMKRGGFPEGLDI